MKFIYLIGLISSLLFSSCASVATGTHKMVAVDTNPVGAVVEVYNGEGDLVTMSTTPFTIPLKRSAGIFKGGENYLFIFSLDGYVTDSIILKPSINGWYFGNLLIGGPVGLIIDPITGAMWTFPEYISHNLIKK